MSEPLDTIIIGAGTAGLAALREVRKRTSRYLIVNDGPWGTTCARVGCMPSKTLIEAANAFHRRHAFEEFGIRGGDALSADIPAVLQRVRALRDDFVAGVMKATDNLGHASISGRATLLGPGTVDIDGKVYQANSIVIATGSRPKVPEEWLAFGDRMLTTDTLFEQASLGPRIAVVGMGAIGVELSQALARLGLQVAAFSTGDTLAGLSDPGLNEELAALLKQDMVLHTGEPAELREVAGGIEVSSGPNRVVVDQVIAAMGRTPNIEHLGLETLGVPLDKRGLPQVDPKTLQVGNLRVFMPGDANTQVPLLHEAADEGHIAGMNAMADTPTRFQRRTPLAIVFCDPNIATVGQRLEDLDPTHTVTGTVSFADQGRARAAMHNHGQLLVHVDKATGRLLGAELCAPDGEHLAHLLALAIHRELTVQCLLGMPFYHPTLEEGLRTALREVARQLPDGSASDLATCGGLGVPALD
ncbi:dihydrolipoamide dehydrogenase [Acidovorax sp. Leaf76]|uniref:dihydrolipoyl dehydrogenase n=1 Tax=unclassified Acidovorax TaxID=2684926 RepID=UPI0007011428|nr:MULTISPECIES: dihydrolipoyl dehydrogenase [unclassified Acidovorax]KQO12297.1 dihydrolipoamide dehydrogenase [Acidovorax sp. Leaf76]KQO29136.1 dihydrolipoamide dehydrogenase [Acidovorax sp. Leaf84]KQS25658.1 dihydrolipoamide dehydrogenase [Acidovorax sp. Leaf191]